jgi:anti-sigma B factor antagonist
MRRLTDVVTDCGLPIVDSIPEALQLIEEAIRTRRQFLYGKARQREPQRNNPPS